MGYIKQTNEFRVQRRRRKRIGPGSD